MPQPTLLDIAKATGNDGLAGLIEEVLPAVPEVAIGAARTIKGTQYKATIRTAVPAGSFRKANVGSTPVKSTYEQRLFECYIANPIWLCDKMVADAHEDGAAAFIAAEAQGVITGEMITLGNQFYYGVPDDPNLGFPGLISQYDATNMTVDATGAAANTGSSVWFLKWGELGVQWLYGNGTNPLQMSDVKEVPLQDANGKVLTNYHQELMAWVGLKLGSLKGAVRIKNLTAEAGKGLTDNLLADALTKFPVGYVPDAILMSRRSLAQLRKSRTATNATGAPAPFPTEYEKIPIVLTDSIKDTEAIS